MGVVYCAEDGKLNRQVALKFLPLDSIGENDKRRFLNEARLAASARHPNICPIYDIDEDDGRLFIAMALLDGQTLRQKLAAGPMSMPQALSIAGQIAGGLHRAHSLGIVHRDIKSGNIMVDPAGHVSIMDFGLALHPETARLTDVGRTVGTPGYMSPEQAQGLRVDPRSDIWSLGVVLFEMVTGRLPFRREHAAAVAHAIVSDPVPDIASLRAGVPADLIVAIRKAMAKRPEDRWQSAEDLAAALRAIKPAAGDRDLEETQLLTGQMTIAPQGFRRWMLLAGLGLVLLTSGFGYWHFRRSNVASVPPAPVSSQRQVAVLPFDVPGSDAATHTISDGLEEVLTDALSNSTSDLVSVPLNEIRGRKIGTADEAQRIYGVAYTITGKAEPVAGGKLNFTLNATDAATSRQTGSETFIYDPANPVESRDRAVAAEMKLLKVDLTPAAATAESAARAGDSAAPEAYSAYLKGRGLLVRYDVAGNVDKALALFQSAVKSDPHYALAWSGLAEAELQKARALGRKEWSQAAVRDAEHAERLDDSLGLAHSILGRIYASGGREDDAVRELKRAIEISPGNPEAPRELARVYSNLGRFPEAEASYLRATAARPTDWYAHMLLGIFYYSRERYGEAEKELKKARDLTPDNENVLRVLGGILTVQGRYPEAIEQYRQALKIRADAGTYAALGNAYFHQHRYQEAVDANEAAIDMTSTVYAFWGNGGVYYKWLKGSEQKSAPSLRRAIELGLKNLETNPRDYSLLANLAEYYARLGQAKQAAEKLRAIPRAAEKPLASRMATVYELTGKRADAIRVIRENLRTKASLNQIRDEPDLSSLWNSPEMRQIVAATP